MTNRDKHGKSLGQDPFADLDDLDFEAIDAAASKPVPNWLKSAQGETDKPSPPPQPKPKPKPKPAAKPKPDPEPQKAKPSFGATVAAQVPPAAPPETKPVPHVAVEPEVPDMVATPDQADDHLLDDLISTIDEEIDRTFGYGVAADFAARRQREQTARQAQYVIFRLAGTDYAAPALNIKEVGEVVNQTPVPNTPPWLLGVTNLRGDILSIVDLRTFLGLEKPDHDELEWQMAEGLLGAEQEMLIAQTGDSPPLLVGLLVDVVSDIRYLALDKIEMPRAPLEDKVTPYLQGVYEDKDNDENRDEFFVLLDFEKLLRSPELKQFEPV